MKTTKTTKDTKDTKKNFWGFYFGSPVRTCSSSKGQREEFLCFELRCLVLSLFDDVFFVNFVFFVVFVVRLSPQVGCSGCRRKPMAAAAN